MSPFTSGAGNPSGYQSPQSMLQSMLKNAQQPTAQIPHPPPWSAAQPQQPLMNAQYGTRRASVSVASSQACYNCGGFNHWAQNCPEPRRALPFGATTNERPYKRQKPNGPILTQSPYPPKPTNPAAYNQRSPFPQRGFTHPQPGRKFQQYSGPPTPISANGSPPIPWQRNWPPSPRPRRPSQQWDSQRLPTPTTASPFPLSSPISPASSSPQQNVWPPPTHIYQHLPAQTPLLGHGSTNSVLQELRQESFPQQPLSILARNDAHNLDQQPKVFSHNVQGEEEGEETKESWWQELQALDYAGSLNDSVHVVSHPANPIAEPLPAFMRDEDPMFRLPIAASLPLGTPVSKYFRDLECEDFKQNFLECCRGRPGADDLALATFTDSCALISKDELIQRRRKMALTANNQANESEGFTEDYLQPVGSLHGARQIDDPSSADGLPTPSQSHEAEEERQAREQEEKLAALGVTGFAKPVRTSFPKSKVPATSAISEDQEVQMACDSSPSHPAINAFEEQRSNPSNGADSIGYGISGSPPGCHYITNSLQTPPTSACHDSRSESLEQYASSNPTCSPDNAQYIRSEAHWSTPGPAEEERKWKDVHSSSKSKSAAKKDDLTVSLVNDGSDGGLSRKRGMREVSPDVDEGPKRQKDDCPQKDKRKAPKVAAAYSRRW